MNGYEINEPMFWFGVDLVILDAAAFDNLGQTISDLRGAYLSAKVLVFSSLPDWRQAREALLAGAIDYLPKSLDRKQAPVKLREALEKRAPQE